jgi:hypothetical protein
MIVGGMKRSWGLSFLGVVLRAVTCWFLIMGIYVLCGLLFGFAMGDLGAFIDAKTGNNSFIRFYPVAVLIIATAGFYYPRADFFNINRTIFKRMLLFFTCFMPLYLMLIYMLFVKSDIWGLCFSFGFRSSLLAFVISLPMIFCNASDSLTLTLFCVLQFLFRGSPTNFDNESSSGQHPGGHWFDISAKDM